MNRTLHAGLLLGFCLCLTPRLFTQTNKTKTSQEETTAVPKFTAPGIEQALSRPPQNIEFQRFKDPETGLPLFGFDLFTSFPGQTVATSPEAVVISTKYS